MGLSQTELIKFILFAIVGSGGIAGIAVPLVLYWLKRKRRKGVSITAKGPVVGKIETGGGDVIIGDNATIQKGPTREEIKESFKEVLRESRVGVSPPVSNEEFEKQIQIESLQARLAQKDIENARLRFERGTERLEAENYEGAIEDLEGALKILPEDSEASLSTHFNLGIALAKFPRGNRESNLRKAVESYKKILSFHTIGKTPEHYASVQNNLGAAYWSLSEVRDKEANLGLAINAFNEALRVGTFDRFPQGYAMTQNNLGSAYKSLSEVRDKKANLGLAIKACNEALRVYTFDRFPQGYAMTQGNLGNAYRGLSEVRDKESNLGQAITAYGEALRVYTLERFPQQYAAIQNNLGNVYCGLAEVRDRDKEGNLGQAINAYKEALRVRTIDRFPQDYAMTQNNLGNAYRGLSGVRDKEDNLNKAIECYKEALKVRTKETLPWNFVETSWNLALVLYEKGDLAGASRVMEGMLPVAEGVGHPGVGRYRQFYEELKRQVR